MFVPVVDFDQNPLMPTTPARARRWIESGKATGFFKKGVFCVRLNKEPSGRETQPIAVGIDPGSKKEAFTVKSEAHTYLNIETDTVDWVKKAIEVRRNMRRSRRYRKTPYRKNRKNRSRGSMPHSTRARWLWKLRICKWLDKMFPITCFIVEDIKARTTNKRQWNASFSPLETGKKWFYKKLKRIANVELKLGYETFELRKSLKLNKTSNKLSGKFSAHCVDSWVLANYYVGRHTRPDNKEILYITPLRFYRRQLHYLQFSKGGVRKRLGGTRSLGFKRGSIVKHIKRGVCYVGGTSKCRISLYNIENGKRLCQNAKLCDCKFLTYSSWRYKVGED